MLVVIRGPVDDATGYAEVTRGLATGLSALGVDVDLRPFSWGAVLEHSEDPVKHLVGAASAAMTRPHAAITVGIPLQFIKVNGARSIGITMTEVDRVPAEWRDACERVDDVWVPSSSSKVAFEKGGVNPSKVRVVPLGVDTDTFVPRDTSEAVDTRSPFFTFLSVFEWVPRKGYDLLVRAFAEEFADDEPVELLLRTHSNSEYDPSGGAIKRQLRDMLVLIGREAARIAVLPSMTTKRDLALIYRASDCFVLPTRGEGWNLPSLEAAACALPVITTNWSAQTDYLDESNSYLIEVQALEPVPKTGSKHDQAYAGALWALPSVAHLRTLMRHVYEHHDEALERGKTASTMIRSKFTWKQASKRVESLLRECGDGAKETDSQPLASALKLKKMLIGMVIPSWGQHCGVAEYAAALRKAQEEAGSRVMLLPTEVMEALALEKYMVREIVHFQYEYSLYDQRRFSALFQLLLKSGVLPVVTLHSYTRRAAGQNEFLKTHAPAIIVHSGTLRQTLRDQGFNQRIEVIRMPASSLRPSGRVDLPGFQNPSGGPNIGFAGSMHVYKGLEQLSESVRMLRARLPGSTLHVFSSVVQNPASLEYSKRFEAFIAQRRLDSVVRLHVKWHPEQDLVDYLSTMDLNVFPYTECGYESTSASVRLAMAAGKPVVTSSSPFFSDLTDEVLKVESVDPESLVDAISIVLSEPRTAEGLTTTMRQYVETNTWEYSARRHLAFYESLQEGARR